MKIDNLTIKNILPVTGLYGLAVCGGNSSRMGTDKSMLVYHQKPQRYHIYEMLQPICEKVFISCNTKQAAGIESGYSIITDLQMYNNIGPMAALLTAFTQYPGNDFLMIGCDYPFLESADLYAFLSYRKRETAAAFYNESENVYEPMLAYYHRNSKKEIMSMFSKGQYSLQQFLREDHAIKYYPKNKKSISSINTKEDFTEAKESINL